MKYNLCTADNTGDKKHPCPDCAFCQHCGDSRCDVCLREQCARAKAKKKTTAKKASSGKSSTRKIKR